MGRGVTTFVVHTTPVPVWVGMWTGGRWVGRYKHCCRYMALQPLRPLKVDTEGSRQSRALPQKEFRAGIEEDLFAFYTHDTP